MTIKEAKELDLVDYLSSLGYKPQKVSGKSYWYLSPLHDEKTASFKVNRNMNRWYDFAEGKGGNLVDFGTLYHKCSISDFLQSLNSPVISHKKTVVKPNVKGSESNAIKILSVQPITSYALLRYLQTRRIHQSIAHKYCQEVRYQTGEKTYYALGFKNDAGGYELRSENFKTSSSPKDSTFIDNGAKNLAVFEGFFNFLSYRNMYYSQQEPLRNFLILNSTSFFEKGLPKMQEHERVHLYLDNDKTGEKYTQQALALDNKKFIDERSLYKLYNDLNDWLIHIGQTQKQSLRPKP